MRNYHADTQCPALLLSLGCPVSVRSILSCSGFSYYKQTTTTRKKMLLHSWEDYISNAPKSPFNQHRIVITRCSELNLFVTNVTNTCNEKRRWLIYFHYCFGIYNTIYAKIQLYCLSNMILHSENLATIHKIFSLRNAFSLRK